MSRGVEEAGFETQPQSSQIALGAGAPLVSVDSFAFLRLRRRPTGATVGSLTRGLLVPNQRFCRFFRFFPEFASFFLLFPFFATCFLAFPPISRQVQIGHLGDLFTFIGSTIRCNRPGCSMRISRALPVGQSLVASPSSRSNLREIYYAAPD